jgi:hypothetical protein
MENQTITSELEMPAMDKVLIKKIGQLKAIVADLDNLVAEIPPTRPNLKAGQFTIISKDYVRRKASITGSVKNYGTNLQAPFMVTFAVTYYYIDGGQPLQTTTVARTFEVSGDVMISGNGGEFVTEAIEVPIYFANDDIRNRYEFEIHIDDNSNIIEIDESDNHRMDPWHFWKPMSSPSAVAKS